MLRHKNLISNSVMIIVQIKLAFERNPLPIWILEVCVMTSFHKKNVHYLNFSDDTSSCLEEIRSDTKFTGSLVVCITWKGGVCGGFLRKELRTLLSWLLGWDLPLGLMGADDPEKSYFAARWRCYCCFRKLSEFWEKINKSSSLCYQVAHLSYYY